MTTIRQDVITLYAESPAAHEVFDTSHTETARTVFCGVRSVGMTEAYTAMSAGLKPSLVFVLALGDDYQNERKLKYNDTWYKVVRTYASGDTLELVAERMDADV